MDRSDFEFHGTAAAAASTTATSRSRRVATVLFSWLVFLLCAINNITNEDSINLDTNTNGQGHEQLTKPKKIRVFYNVFTKGPEDEERVQKIVDEQLELINPELHDTNISISSIGHLLSDYPKVTTVTHHESGNEELSLHALWKYCQEGPNNNRDTKVVYIHSKGSYHPRHQNDLLRRALTYSALSEECAKLPDTCNVCATRMSPLPYPHTPGNMWLARCDYVAKLASPHLLKEGKIPRNNDYCSGFGRYYYEHWVHSHPDSSPCDLYDGGEFTWDYYGIPRVPFAKKLKSAPRFNYCHYIHKHCRAPPIKFYETRMWYYNLLYNITSVDESWWGFEELVAQKILNNSDPEELFGFKCL